MTGVPELLQRETDEAFEILLTCIGDLTDEEYAWEPGPGVWRVFRDEHGRWTHDYAEPDPVPSPFTTIGWRVAHVATCKVMYHEWAFGPRRLTWLTIDTPHEVGGALAMLHEGHDLLRADLAALDEAGLNAEVLLGRALARMADLLDDDPPRPPAGGRVGRPPRLRAARARPVTGGGVRGGR